VNTLKFKDWLIEGLTEPPRTVDQARRPDLIKGGTGGCPELPMGVRSMCEPTTSAFQVGSLPKQQKKMKKR